MAGSYVGAMSTDRTPVFYASTQLNVTGMRISAGSKVLPVSAIATVEVLGARISALFDSLKLIGLGVILALIGASLTKLGVGLGIWALMFVAGLLAVLAGCLGTVSFFFERTLQICPSSGNSLRLRVYDEKVAFEMRSAVDRAITYHANLRGGSPSVGDELGRLGALRSQGVISDSDWERAKDLFLGTRPTAQEQAIEQLKRLHGLYRSGVLSESEFNMKKWDVLSRAASW